MTTDISGGTAVGVQGQRRSAAPGELGHAAQTCRAHSRTLLFVLDDIDNRLRPDVLIQRIQQHASVSKYLGDRSSARRDDRSAAPHRLEERQPEALIQ